MLYSFAHTRTVGVKGLNGDSYEAVRHNVDGGVSLALASY